MKMSSFRRIGFLLICGFLLPLFWNQSSSIAEAATPTFMEEEIEISGIGEEYPLEILNKKDKSKYKWTSLDKSIAKVSSKGLITTVDKGSTRIKCKITYSSGKVKNLYCKVKVYIPASDIEINNATEKNGAHIMRVGERYNFNRTLTPDNSSDMTYWSLDASVNMANPDAVRIDNSSNGTVTALRRGKIRLVATAVKASFDEEEMESYVKDAIIIEVIGSSAEVASAKILNAKTIKVEFGTAVRESTVINSSGNLSSNIMVTKLDDSSGITAKDPGTLTASLSGNLMTLTITASNYFQGSYGITFSDKILTSSGIALYEDYFKLDYSDGSSYDDYDDINYDDTYYDDTYYDDTVIDTGAPRVASTVLDDNGMTTLITFSEKMDFSKFEIVDAKIVSSSNTVQASTINFLKSKSRYSFGSDGKTILINMSGISSEDYDKAFAVTISGATDTSGNKLDKDNFTVVIRTETTSREQARPISVVRSAYNTITATFSRSIRTPGYATINNGGYYYGEVDPDNNKQVDYKISDYDATLSGTQSVSIGHWDSYNVIAGDTYANQLYRFTVFFMTEKVKPVLISYDFNPELSILTLKYSENVSMFSPSGYFNYTMDSYQRDNNRGILNYSEASTVDNVVEITLKNLTLFGDYTFVLPEGFVLDDYHNQSNSSSITIYNVNNMEGANKLAEPYSIYQSDVNHSLIYVKFADRLDVTTALDISNYYISSATIEDIKLINNTSDGATIQITLTKGSITSTGDRKISISNIKGYNGSASEMAAYTPQINLKENIDPFLKNIIYDSELKNVIILTFSEPIKGDMSVTVQERTTGYFIGSTVTVSGDKVTITLGNIPSDGTYLQIIVHNNNITDLNGNESKIDPVLSAFVNY
ncbi:MAG TPA: Ig-like domain-containing protein [Mobilitalea sp.]|nr:Ig-like domain-containing protein [Mobilitalea sp.]